MGCSEDVVLRLLARRVTSTSTPTWFSLVKTTWSYRLEIAEASVMKLTVIKKTLKDIYLFKQILDKQARALDFSKA